MMLPGGNFVVKRIKNDRHANLLFHFAGWAFPNEGPLVSPDSVEAFGNCSFMDPYPDLL